MFKYTLAVVFSAFIIVPHLTYSQKLDWCGTAQAMEQEMKLDPEYAKKQEALNNYYKQYESTHYKVASGTVYTIPMVFHIIHNYGAENISDDQIIDAVKVINTDYRKLNDDTSDIVSSFKSIAADIGIQFKLATIDPNGNCTNGITRYVSDQTFSADDDVKKLVDWDPSKYLNVWVVDVIESGAGGYSYLPGVSSWKDGIVILNSQLGSIGTSCGSDLCVGSLTHEIGHYLNLKHTWGSTNTPGVSSNCSDDDDVTDTPNCIGSTSCDLTESSCGTLANVQNYMDYAGCLCMFTEGQKSRMLAALTSSTNDRDNLWTTTNLKATGTYSTSTVDLCTADFTYDNAYICPGGSVKFTEDSWNGDPTSWAWTFTGGTPSSSTDSTPTIVYNTVGEYAVSLTVSNASGSASTTQTSIIHVGSTTPEYGPDYTEDFESSSKFSSDWEIINIDGGKTWSRSSSASYQGSYSLELNNFGNSLKSVDEIISPSIDLSYITSPKLNFKIAYAQQTTDDGDGLKISVSTDCGKTWSLRYSKQGASLTSTSTLYTSSFTPKSSEWEDGYISFTSSMLTSNARVKFEFTNDGGNNLYLDDLNISGTINGIETIIPLDVKFDVLPNPIENNSVVKFYLVNNATCSLSICDVLGRETKIMESKKMLEGEQSFLISNYIKQQGVYFIKLQVGDRKFVKSVVK